MAVLLTDSTANGGVGGQVDGVDPLRNPGIFRCAWISKNYKGAFIHEIGHLFGARREIDCHICCQFLVNDEFCNLYKMTIWSAMCQQSFNM